MFGDEIRLVAEHAPLSAVLEQIATHTGVRVHSSVIPEPSISVSCAGATVEQVAECLFGADANFIVRHRAGASKTDPRLQPEELWMLQTSLWTPQPAGGGGEVGACANSRAAHAARQTPAPKSQASADQTRAEATATGKLVELATAEDPVRREQGLSRLAVEGRADDSRVRQTLENALSDEDASVRAQAVAGLARQGGEDLAAVLQQALRDSDASVRLMAVDSAGSDALGLALLREALADSDETVSALAAMKLGSRRNNSMTN